MGKIYPVEKELAGGCATMSAQEARYQASLARDWNCRGAQDVFAVFQEMEDRDPHLFSVLQTRKNALLACGTKVLPADDSPAAQEAARTVEQVLARTRDLPASLYHLLDALSKGFAVAEVLWRVDGESGRVEIDVIRGRYQGDFAFDTEGALWLLGERANTALPAARGEHRAAALIPRPGETQVWGREMRRMPPRKFLHFAFQGNTCTPYGAALCAKVYWYCWYKRQNLQTWSLYNERFGAPATVGRYPVGTSDEERLLLQDIVDNLQRESGAILPENLSIEYLEAKRGGNATSYRELADWCNDEISKAVLGQTLTAGEGRRSGSLALAEVHDRVRRDYLAADSRALGEVLGGQLARWITDFNHGPHVPAPHVVFDCDDHSNAHAELQVDRELVKMGVSLPARYFYEKYRRPQPGEHERVLRYDDANLYQYHLLFGVLTINEVRATLGLPPVAWGDTPPREGEAKGGGVSSVRKLGAGEQDEGETPDSEEEGRLPEAARDRRAR